MTHGSVITQEMRDAIGVESDPVAYEVEKGALIKFAQAIGDPNPLFNDEEVARSTRYRGLLAPPTFLRSMIPARPKVEPPSPYPAGLDGGSEWEYFEPVRPGDRITVTTKIVDMFERHGQLGDMLFIIRETRYVNQSCNVVALEHTTGIGYQPPER